MERGLATALAALFALSLISGCAAPSGGTPSSFWMPGWGWEGMGGLALAIMAMVLGLAYMASTLLGDEAMRAWTKKEVVQLGYSALILVVAVALVGNIDGWLKLISTFSSGTSAWEAYVTKAVCCNPSVDPGCLPSPALAHSKPCHIALATDYLQILFESGHAQASWMILNYYWTGFLSNVMISAGVTGLMDILNISWRPLSFLSVDMEFYSVLYDLAFKTMMFIRLQQVFLDYLWSALFPLMMSMGLVLRIFHFSRKLGGMLVALALAMYVVLPMLYVLFSGILFGFMGGWGSGAYFGNSVDQSQMMLPGTSNAVDLSTMTGQQTFGTTINAINVCGSASSSESSSTGDMIDILKQQMMGSENNNWSGQSIDSMNDRFGLGGPVANLATLMVLTLVTPFLALMTTLAAFKYFSPLIGGDVEISLLSRLI